MKKGFLIAMITICSCASFAQFQFGAQVGANLGLSHSDFSTAVTGSGALVNNPKVGLLIGVLGEVGFGQIAFRPELNFIQKGSKTGGYNYGFGVSDYDVKTTLNYVELPLNVVYNLKLSRAGKVFFGLGPAIGFGLSGKQKGPVYVSGSYAGTEKVDVKFDGESNSSNNDRHLKRADIGANILAGFQLKMGAFAKISYTHGFANIDPVQYQEYKNRGFSIAIGYMIGKN